MHKINLSVIYRNMGNMIAPARFVAFATILISLCSIMIPIWGWGIGFMVGFDCAAVVFLMTCWSLLDNKPAEMRYAAKLNDANRLGLLAITGMVMLVLLATVASELRQKEAPHNPTIILIIVTLTLSWIFSNIIYALHYAHLFYTSGEQKEDRGGLRFPGTEEPDYRDFIYFAFCLGMTFQTSDVEITDRHFRIVVTMQCLAAFVFNLGIIAFTINVLGE
ncbi:DUF1345 domain-containing protein [Pseudochelatococcus sp. G4_1912]|uniref:DUF1345 domain-containing protein n=1 Tax=Pseudochelatococcus sp. G4_1912 TaxID=3114288 RepID=UPI0039C5C945